MIIIQRRSIAVCFTAVILVACTEVDNHDSSSTTIDQPAPGSMLANCETRTPLTCNVPAGEGSAEGMCAQISSCIKQQGWGDWNKYQVLGCDEPRLSSETGPVQLAGISASLDDDGLPLYGSVLFLRSEQGWCPADIVMEPDWTHGGYCDSSFEFDWPSKGVPEATPLLIVTACRTCRMPLDEEELLAGESDIASVDCIYSWYELVGDQLIRKER